MPIVNPDAATQQAASASESRNKRRAARQSAKTEEPAVAVLNEQKMLNLPGMVRVGGLSLRLTAPVIDKAAEVHNDIYTKWPDVLIFAVMGDLEGKGIKPEAIAEGWTAQRRQYQQAMAAAGNSDASDGIGSEPVTIAEVRSAVAQLSMGIGSLLPDIASTVWALAEGSPGLHWPPPDVSEGEERPSPPDGTQWLDDAIRQSLTIPQLADLLRELLYCCGGFPGGIQDRFETP
jgi:hypothetical protein